MKTLLLLISLLFSCNALSRTYTNSTSLSNDYALHWSVVGDSIYIAMEANTTGWVGFGIGEITSGSMPGSDIVTGHVDSNGKTAIVDRFAEGFYMPEPDTCQDWELVSGEESNGKTTIEVKRKLYSNDTQDRNIVPGYNRIVWAIGSSDTFSYHTSKFFAQVAFYEAPNETIPETDIFHWEWSVNNGTIETLETDYQCAYFELPYDENEESYLIGFETLVDPVAAPYLHHFLLYFCDNADTSWITPQLQKTQNCYLPSARVTTCPNVIIWAWAPGMNRFLLPKETGFKLGGNSTFRSAYIQMHYTNPQKVPGVFDNSTVRFTFTKTPREFEAGVVIIGDNKFTLDPIPPRREKVHYELTCPSECTKNLAHNITFFSDLLHLHDTGSQIYTTVTTNSSFVTKNRIDFYDYNLQQNTPQHFVVQPGDQINLHCIFNTMNRAENTLFGYGSYDEMCLNFAYYYPRVLNFRNCGYFKNQTTGTEYTQCDNKISSVPRPPVKDSIDLSDIEFGKDSYNGQCPFTTTTTGTTNAGGSTTETQMEESSASVMFHSISVLFVVLYMIIFQ